MVFPVGRLESSVASLTRCGWLSDFQISQTNLLEGFQLSGNFRVVFKENNTFVYRHFQNVIDGFPFVFHRKRFTVIAFSLADFAGNVNVRQKVHFNAQDAVALACLASAAFHIKGEPSGSVALCLCIVCFCEKVSDVCENAGVCCRVGTGRSADRRLVDVDHLVQEFRSVHAVKISVACSGTV